MLDSQITQLITLVIAVGGFVLGVVNFWRALYKDRFRMQVRPGIAAIGHKGLRLSVHVLNCSHFEVTVTDVQLVSLRGRRLHLGVATRAGGSLPVTLKPRTAVTLFFPAGTREVDGIQATKWVGVETACGHFLKDRSPALRHFAKHTPAAGDAREVWQMQDAADTVKTSTQGIPSGYAGPV